MSAVSAATGQVLSTGSPVDHGHRLASYDASLVISGGVDCERRRRNVHDKKPQCYAKVNRTAHLTARSDKKVKVKEHIVLREIHLRTTGRHLSIGSHSVICHPTEVTAPPSPQPGRLVLDLSTP